MLHKQVVGAAGFYLFVILLHIRSAPFISSVEEPTAAVIFLSAIPFTGSFWKKEGLWKSWRWSGLTRDWCLWIIPEIFCALFHQFLSTAHEGDELIFTLQVQQGLWSVRRPARDHKTQTHVTQNPRDSKPTLWPSPPAVHVLIGMRREGRTVDLTWG